MGNHNIKEEIMDRNKMVCHCRKVTIGDIEKAVNEGAKTFEEVQQKTKVSTGCRRCLDHAKNVAESFIKEKQ